MRLASPFVPDVWVMRRATIIMYRSTNNMHTIL